MNTKLLVNGKLVKGKGDELGVLDPATGKVIAQVAEASEEQITAAVKAAAKAFPGWAATVPKDRGALLMKLADRIEAEAMEFARLESLNCGKPLNAALNDELPAIADVFRFFAGAARCMTGAVAGEYMPGLTSMIRRDPIGVVASIAPWNYPLMMAAWKMAPALAAGNTIVLKPSEQTPLTTLKLATISLTGSVASGEKVLTAAVNGTKRTHLELGGKAPVIVFDDADLESVVSGLKAFGYYNAGQDCTAACRVYAGKKIYDNLVADLSSAAKELKYNLPDDDENEIGPLISSAQKGRVQSFVERA